MTAKTTRILVVFAVVAVIAGLLALALPAVTASTQALSASAVGAESTPPVEPTEEAAPAAVTEDDDDTLVPDGYVDIGHGMSIPAGGVGDCTATAWFWTGSENGDTHMHAELLGTLEDMGPMPFAQGTVDRDANGTIVSYTVASGDALYAIGDRLCAEGVTIGGYNNVRPTEIQPGQTLDLNPDPDAVWTNVFVSSR